MTTMNHTFLLNEVLNRSSLDGEAYVNGQRAFYSALAENPDDYETAYSDALDASAVDHPEWEAGWNVAAFAMGFSPYEHKEHHPDTTPSLVKKATTKVTAVTSKGASGAKGLLATIRSKI